MSDQQRPPRSIDEILNDVLGSGPHLKLTEEEEEIMRAWGEEEGRRTKEALNNPIDEGDIYCENCSAINPKQNQYCRECGWQLQDTL